MLLTCVAHVLHARSMSMLRVHSLSEEPHHVLRVQAAQAGQSLSDYVAGLLDEVIAKPTLDEWLETVSQLQSPKSELGIAEILREKRNLV